MNEYKGKGGWRGGGRPKKDPADYVRRPNHGMRAWPEEWKLIRRFKKCVVKDIQLAEEYLEAMEKEIYSVKSYFTHEPPEEDN